MAEPRQNFEQKVQNMKKESETDEHLKYKMEEIDAVYAELRKVHLEAVEKTELKSHLEPEQDAGDMSFWNSQRQAKSSYFNGLGLGGNMKGDTKPSRHHFNVKFKKIGADEKESSYTGVSHPRSERYRLAFVPWEEIKSIPTDKTGDVDKKKLSALSDNMHQQRLAQIPEYLTLYKRLAIDALQKYFVGWIKIQNTSSSHHLSYNVNEYNPQIFHVPQPVGFLAPNESKNILIKTNKKPDDLELNMIDLTQETFTVYVAPCKMIDLYNMKSSDGRGSRAIDGETGDQGQVRSKSQAETQVQLFTTQITQQHVFDFWASYKTIWFPEAEIYSIKELRPYRLDWLQEPSLLKKPKKYHRFNGEEVIMQPKESSDITYEYDPIIQAWTPKYREYKHVIFGQPTQDNYVGEMIFKYAVFCVVLFCIFLYQYQDSSGFLSEQLEQVGLKETSTPAATEMSDDVKSSWSPFS